VAVQHIARLRQGAHKERCGASALAASVLSRSAPLWHAAAAQLAALSRPTAGCVAVLRPVKQDNFRKASKELAQTLQRARRWQGWRKGGGSGQRCDVPRA
jgi:hypothetical protein